MKVVVVLDGYRNMGRLVTNGQQPAGEDAAHTQQGNQRGAGGPGRMLNWA